MAQEQVIDDDLALIREREEQIRELEVRLSQVSINKTFKRKGVNIFLPFNFNISFECSKEPSH